uniref:Protein kinase domain-containing protein n=1 Tax=Vitis vinifera TaxID=29760 RepID=F6I3L4_VITVI
MAKVFLHYEPSTPMEIYRFLFNLAKIGRCQFASLQAQLMTKIHHRNLVPLIGYYNERQHLGLVYEYMTNGNLQEYLSTTNTAVLSWDHRLRIVVDTAQALEYLHNGCKLPIIHKDVKTSNILLDEKLQAKVTYFRLSRIMPDENGSHASTAVVGRVGYLDLEYFRLNKLNKKWTDRRGVAWIRGERCISDCPSQAFLARIFFCTFHPLSTLYVLIWLL